MMKRGMLTLAGAVFVCCSFAQTGSLNANAAIDKVALQIPDSLTRTTLGIARYIAANFKTEKEQVRAAYIWVARNIQYDVANMYAINFYEKPDEKVAKALNTRRGICEAYATLLQQICTGLGIKSYVVEGYTKQNGFADYIPHAWCAARTDGAWLLYDPTWGSGYVINGRFVRRLNEGYFAAKPGALIRSHMPFDPLWQFLYYPVSSQEFYDGRVAENKSKPYFSYPDSITVWDAQSHTEQLTAAARRIESAGIKSSMIFDRLHHIQAELEHERQSSVVNNYNGAIADYNEGLNYYNTFIEYRNKQFTPKRPDEEIQAMLSDAAARFSSAKAKVASIKSGDIGSNAASIIQLTKSIDDADGHRQEMQEWLTKYFSKGKAARKSMFYKMTWFGVPLN